jgi:hypothetical protein
MHGAGRGVGGGGVAALLSILPLMDDPPLRRRNRRLLGVTTTTTAAAAAAAEVMAGELTDAAQRGRGLDLSDFTTVRRRAFGVNTKYCIHAPHWIRSSRGGFALQWMPAVQTHQPALIPSAVVSIQFRTSRWRQFCCLLLASLAKRSPSLQGSPEVVLILIQTLG